MDKSNKVYSIFSQLYAKILSLTFPLYFSLKNFIVKSGLKRKHGSSIITFILNSKELYPIKTEYLTAWSFWEYRF